jgi:hypothetical protein
METLIHWDECEPQSAEGESGEVAKAVKNDLRRSTWIAHTNIRGSVEGILKSIVNTELKHA